MSNKFKIGDVVECTSSEYVHVVEGELLTVALVTVDSIGFNNYNNKTILLYPHEDFKLHKSAESEKWHPHHDLILKWLSSEDMRVSIYSHVTDTWREVNDPFWDTGYQYRVYHKDTTEEQLKIEEVKSKIASLQDELKLLEGENV